VPLEKAIYDLQFRGFLGIDRDDGLPFIPASIFTLADTLSYYGWMTWNELGLSGFWGISVPWNGVARYRIHRGFLGPCATIPTRAS
jgi:hypothetical protein